MSLKHISELRKVAKALGLTVERIEQGKHFKFYLDTPQGKKTLTVSITPSDSRVAKNNKGILKGWAK